MDELTIELVPSTCWYSNVRSQVSKESWNKIKRKVNNKSKYKCEICGASGKDQGFDWPVEVHEIWGYNDGMHTQTLVGMQSLCPLCHTVKHIGLAQIRGCYSIAIDHMCRINEWSPKKANIYIDKSFELYYERSKHDWTLDISYLERENLI